MSDADLYETTGPGVSRRGFMKIGAAGGAAAVGLGGAGTRVPGPVGNSQAIAPAVVYGGYIVGSAALAGAGWLLREHEVIGADDPPEGMTPEVLQNEIYDDARKRLSNNRSDFVDNQNIIASGHRHSLYSDGKIAAIEALNDEKSESEVLAAANAAAEEFAAVVQENFLKGWNATVLEHDNLTSSIADHPDLTTEDVTGSMYGHSDDYYLDPTVNSTTVTHTLPDGRDFDMRRFQYATKDGHEASYDPTSLDAGSLIDPYIGQFQWQTSAGDVTYMIFDEWNAIWTELTSALSDVKNGLSTWVTGVYGDVQAGELDTGDLLTARERAEMSASEEGSFDQAVADLMALNISTNLKREAEVHLPDIDATVNGQLSVTSDTSLSTGTVDPSADNHDYYLTYDVSQGEGTWSAYNSGIDGGVLTFTEEPFESTEYDVSTNAGETVTVTASDFTDQGDGTWTVDLSDQLETSIAEVDSISYFATTSETQYETVQLTDTFEIVTFTNTETGEEHDSAEVTSGEPQDDTNYITSEEWQDMQDRQQELIDKYEEAKAPGGAGSILPDGLGGSTGMLLLVAAGAAGVLGLQGDN